MRLCAGLTSAKLTPFPRSSTTSWTTDSEYLFGAEFSLHGKKITPNRLRGWSILNSFRRRVTPTRREPNQGFAIAGWLGNPDSAISSFPKPCLLDGQKGVLPQQRQVNESTASEIRCWVGQQTIRFETKRRSLDLMPFLSRIGWLRRTRRATQRSSTETHPMNTADHP